MGFEKKLGEGAAGVTFAASEVSSGKFAEINQVSGGKSSITMAIEKIKERIFVNGRIHWTANLALRRSGIGGRDRMRMHLER
jgi:hypothetical protein